MATCRVILADEVYKFLSDECEPYEEDVLLYTAGRWEQMGLQQVLAETIERPDIASEQVRWFRFGNCIAVLKVETDEQRVMITECQRRRPGQ